MSKFVKRVFSVFVTGLMVIGVTSSINVNAYAADSDEEVTKPQIESIDADKSSDGKVVFKVNANGGKGGNNLLFYKFYKVDKDGNKIDINQNEGIGQNYSLDNTYTCKPDSDNVARIYVEVENSNNDSVNDKKEYKIDNGQTDNKEKTLKISKFTSDIDDNTTKDSEVTLNAEVEKTNIDDVNYKFTVTGSDNNESTIKDSEASTVKWTPGSTGNFKLKLTVTDKEGKTQDSKEMNVEIKEAKNNGGQTPVDKKDLGVTLEVKQDDYYVGSPIKLTANGTGGNGDLTYKFAYDLDSDFGTLMQNFSDKNEYEFTPEKEGTYTLYAYVKDEDGKTKKSKVVKINVNKKKTDDQGGNNNNQGGNNNNQGGNNNNQGGNNNNQGGNNNDSGNSKKEPTGDLSKGLPFAAILAASVGYIVTSKKKKQN